MQHPGHRHSAAAACAAAGVLLLAAPTPQAALAALLAPPADDAAAPLVALLALLAWSLAGWLVLAAALTAGAHLPGHLGRPLRLAARLTVPATVRRSLELALGLSVLAGAAASPATASTAPDPPPPAVAAAATDLDWGTAPPRGSEPSPPTPRAAAARPAHTAAVVVRPDDSLWALAARELQTGGADVTDQQIAQRWPAWWQANRDVIGPDPDLLVPGQQLTPPS